MELIKLKRRIAFARRGHKLLKDKRDSLMKHFMSLVKRAREAHREAETQYEECAGLLDQASRFNPYAELLIASAHEGDKLSAETDYSQVMSLAIPSFRLSLPEYVPQYGELAPKGATKLFRKHRELLLKTVELASLEKGIRMMADEIASTSRRVNALEYILIPRFESDAKRIEMKLEELERSAFSSLNRISE